jgi:hypothetical protein
MFYNILGKLQVINFIEKHLELKVHIKLCFLNTFFSKKVEVDFDAGELYSLGDMLFLHHTEAKLNLIDRVTGDVPVLSNMRSFTYYRTMSFKLPLNMKALMIMIQSN